MCTYVQLDPARRQLSGAKGGISIERAERAPLAVEAGTSFTTPEFETNDIGRLATADGPLLFGGAGPVPAQTDRRDAGIATVRGSASGTQQAAATTAAIVQTGWPSDPSVNLTAAELLGEPTPNATYSDPPRTTKRLTRGGPLDAAAEPRGPLDARRGDAARRRGRGGRPGGRCTPETEDGGLLSMALAPQIQRAARRRAGS